MASFATKPEQYISDSVGPLPEVCPIAGTHSARSPAFRTPTRRTDVIKPLIFIPTSDVSSSTPLIFCGEKAIFPPRRSPGTHTSAWNVTKQGIRVKILLIYQWCTGTPKGHVPEGP